MKKTLVALAALASMSAFAQSSVTLSGNLDFAASNSTGTQAIAVGKTVATTTGTSSTSVIRITAVEDLGAGTKATVSYGLDPRPLSNDSLSTTNNTQGTVGAGNQVGATATGLARDAVFVGLEGAYGNVRLGSPNSLGLEVQGNSSPLGTGAGAGYTGLAASTMINSVVNTRYNRSLRYDTPTMSGFTASILFAPGQDVATQAPSATTSGGATALPIPNARKTTEMGLKYVNGPLTASVAQIKQAEMTNTAGYYAGTGKDNKETSATIYGVSYAIGATTLYVGGNTGDRLAAKGGSTWSNAVVESKGTRVAVKHTMGKVDLIAQQTTQETTGASADAKAKVTGLGADYNFSKTTATYFRYQKADSGAAYATTAATASGELKTVSIGMRKSF